MRRLIDAAPDPLGAQGRARLVFDGLWREAAPFEDDLGALLFPEPGLGEVCWMAVLEAG